MASEDHNWAKQYILDPLTAPQPADETGPGTHFRPEPETPQSGMITPPSAGPSPAVLLKDGSSKQAHNSTNEIKNAYPSPSSNTTSPRKPSTSHRQEAFNGEQKHRRRGSSLSERFPGDMSHRPLDQLKQDKSIADRSRHATKKHHIQPDQIDMLDGAAAGGAYHHGGPYDATLFARNNSYNSSPVAAVAKTNNEALKATPKEMIRDSINGHRPLDGTATYAPGQTDRNGNTYRYQEGDNMMIAGNPAGGAYKRWPGVDYHPNDIKGKGEPSYSIEEALKEHKRSISAEKGGMGANSIEFAVRNHRSGSGSIFKEAFADEPGQSTGVPKRSNSLGQKLKRRIGSIKRSHA